MKHYKSNDDQKDYDTEDMKELFKVKGLLELSTFFDDKRLGLT